MSAPESAAPSRQLAAILSVSLDSPESSSSLREALAQEVAATGGAIVPALEESDGPTKAAEPAEVARFQNVRGAVLCALRLQRRLAAEAVPGSSGAFRAAVYLGDVVEGPDGVRGKAVEMSSLLARHAGPGEIALSEAVYDHVREEQRLRGTSVRTPRLGTARQRLRVFLIAPPNAFLLRWFLGKHPGLAWTAAGLLAILVGAGLAAQWWSCRAPLLIGFGAGMEADTDAYRSSVQATTGMSHGAATDVLLVTAQRNTERWWAASVPASRWSRRDLQEYRGLQLRLKAELGSTIFVELWERGRRTFKHGTRGEVWEFPVYLPNPEWITLEVPWSSFTAQPGWEPMPADVNRIVDVDRMIGLAFAGKHGQGEKLWVRDIRLAPARDPDSPARPALPEGPATPPCGRESSYSVVSSDPQYLPLKYRFDWGDGSGETETGLVPPGVRASLAHAWQSPGDNRVRVRAVNILGKESPWSDPFPVSIQHADLVLQDCENTWKFFHWAHPESRIDLSAVPGTRGNRLRVAYRKKRGSDNCGIGFDAGALDGDWSRFSGLRMEVVTERRHDIAVNIEEMPAGEEPQGEMWGCYFTPPAVAGTVELPFERFSREQSGFPDQAGDGKLDTSRIRKVMIIFGAGPLKTVTDVVHLDEISLMARPHDQSP